jgi:purine nucleoside phosphorylase
MSDFITLEMIDRAVDVIRSKTSRKPEVGLILGSGLGIWRIPFNPRITLITRNPGMAAFHDHGS